MPAITHSPIDSVSAYNDAAALQHEVAKRMAERLDYLKQTPARILDIGARTGFGTRLLQQRYPDTTVFALDAAPLLLQQSFPARAKWKQFFGLGEQTALCACADFTHLPFPAACVDMVWSNLALHHLDPDAAFKEAQRVLKPGGLFMFSLFGPDTLKELRAASDDAKMKRLIDMHDVGDVLSHNGFTAPVMDMETLTLTYSALPDLLRDLQVTQENLLLPDFLREAANQNHLSSVAQAYETFRVEGKLPATYEIVYGHAWNRESKKQNDDGTQIIAFRQYKSRTT
jgi:malonyl-CoA O-methyltransferase